jgi:hypothetical protein
MGRHLVWMPEATSSSSSSSSSRVSTATDRLYAHSIGVWYMFSQPEILFIGGASRGKTVRDLGQYINRIVTAFQFEGSEVKDGMRLRDIPDLLKPNTDDYRHFGDCVMRSATIEDYDRYAYMATWFNVNFNDSFGTLSIWLVC